jgi:polar amino acid transport system substrate-binding protein
MRRFLRGLKGWGPEAGLLGVIVVLGVVALVGSAPRLARSDSLRIAAGEVPPHMDGFGQGREADVIRAALRRAGRADVEFHVGPFSRHWRTYARDPRLNAVATVPVGMALEGYATQPHIAYRNGVIYRRTQFPNGLGEKPLETLAGRRVVAFADASRILPGLGEAIPRFASYAEYDDQYVHSAMLAQGAVDAVIADRLIVDAYSRELLGGRWNDPDQRLVFDPIFCPTRYHMVFRSEALGAAFDRGLAAAADAGELARIDADYDQASRIPQVVRDPPKGCGT